MKPPSYIKPHTKPAPKKMQKIVKADNDDFCVYNIICDCGNTHFQVLSEINDIDDSLVDPIILKCISCKKEILLFDSQKHGYDAILCNESENNEENSNDELKSDSQCDKCGNNSFEITVGFEHSVDKEEAKEIINDENLLIGVEDLFTWFSGYTCCDTCHSVKNIYDIECA